jgi:ectoine hydroxylase-related dioxygenase (phytanoyl-CoA dioxygenase family)
MVFDPEPNVAELRTTGITRIAQAFSRAKCGEYVTRLNELTERFAADGKLDLNEDTQVVTNFFRYAPEMLPLVFNPQIDAIFREVIDHDYVLTSTNAINRSFRVKNPTRKSHADSWHSDSRYIGGKRISENFNFVLVIMLEDFTLQNAPTEYIPGSHLDRSIPDRDGNYKGEKLLGEAGTMVIFDAGLWHRGGPATGKSRWSVFNVYSPWFVKPYFRFNDMIARDNNIELTADLRRIFHFDSIPPIDEDEGIATLARVRAMEKRKPKKSG